MTEEQGGAVDVVSEPVEATVDAVPEPVEATPPRRVSRLAAGLAVAVAALSLTALVASRTYRYRSLEAFDTGSEPPKELLQEVKELRTKARRAEASLRALVPSATYVVVDTARNRLYVKKREKVLLEAVCSTGSGGVLKEPDTERQWTFQTPRGRFSVLRKAEDPVWTKPDWAFVEEGKPVPERWSERRDFDTLGDYALYFGDGYMIHGTLYQRYLGQSITHGCVRLGDADLERVFRLTPVGAPILIF